MSKSMIRGTGSIGFIALLALAACSKKSQTDNHLDGAVASQDAQVAGGDARVDAPPAALCEDGRRYCGDNCCSDGEYCTSSATCCPSANFCGSQCCGAGSICEAAVCKIDCGENARCRNGDGNEVCCGENEVCSSTGCFLPTATCSDLSSDCPDGQYCEVTVGSCLPNPTGDECVSVPTGGAVEPELLWGWSDEDSDAQVISTPIVINLTDDNEDSRIDRFDYPDIVFTTFFSHSYESASTIHAIDGRTGLPLPMFAPTISVNALSQIAAGDLDSDGTPEIVTCEWAGDGYGNLVALTPTGAVKWRASEGAIDCAATAPSIADLDGDGVAEVIVRYGVVRGSDGMVMWKHECARASDFRNGRQHSPCDFSTVADLDNDGTLEVVGGNVAFNHDGTIFYDRTMDLDEGYPAVGDLDRDGDPEIVVVQSALTETPSLRGNHFVYVLANDGTTVRGPIDANAGLVTESMMMDNNWGGGPPTIANLDGDPEPEFALATGFGMVAFEPDGTVKWASPTTDSSSRKTGSSVFDFDGDGQAELIYNDEYWMRVFGGTDGKVQYCVCNTTGTLHEYPVVADIDNDGHAEIVVVSNDYAWGDCGPTRTYATDECTDARVEAGDIMGWSGVRAFAGPAHDWVATRGIWNQHTYHVTNVDEDGRIPAHEPRNWTMPGLNNFRANFQPGARNAPDLVLVDPGIDVSRCPAPLTFYVRVRNQGWAGARSGVPISGYYRVMGETTWHLIATKPTVGRILPGEQEIISFETDIGGGDTTQTIEFRAMIGSDSMSSTVSECRTDNDEITTSGSCAILF